MAKTGSVARALINPVGIGVAASAATAAIFLTNPIIAAIGGLAYVTSVAIDAMRRARGDTPKQPVIPGLPAAKDLQDASTRAAVEQILHARSDLQRVLDETPPEVLAMMQKTLSSLDELESYAIRMVTRAEDIYRHLHGVDVPALVLEVKKLAAKAEGARDPSAKQSYEEAKDARMDEIRSLKELKASKDKIDANLIRVVAVLSALPTKVVHMRALDAQALDKLSGDVTTEISEIATELETSEKVIKEIGVKA